MWLCRCDCAGEDASCTEGMYPKATQDRGARFGGTTFFLRTHFMCQNCNVTYGNWRVFDSTNTRLACASRTNTISTALSLIDLSGLFLSAQTNIYDYTPRRAALMKSPPTTDALFASLPIWHRNLGSEQSDRSLFSLLLEIETRLRAEARRDSLVQTHRRRPAKRKNTKRLGVENLSRYIE